MRNRPRPPPSSEITAPALYARRREFIESGALFIGTSAAFGAGPDRPWSNLGSADPPSHATATAERRAAVAHRQARPIRGE